MKYLIITDLHGNYDATRAVLNHVRRKTFDAVLVLGDLVGYGACPNQVVEEVRDLKGRTVVIRGNHDKVIAGLEDGEDFNRVAISSAIWSRSRLTPQNKRYLIDLPEGPVEVDDFSICHGAPIDEDRYLLRTADAEEAFAGAEFDVCFFGHTHVPMLFRQTGRETHGERLKGNKGEIQIEPGSRYLINPGSVGQPRDGNPLAAYMIYDSDAGVATWHRIRYPMRRAQRRILAAGLPEMLAERLEYGA